MNLLIDSGNTYIKWQQSTEESVAGEGRCLTADISDLYDIWKDLPAPARVVVSNVAGEEVASVITKLAADLWRLDVEYASSSKTCCGLTNGYHQPKQLGIDRWMAMLAAYRATGGPVIVVDCGTAVTIDLVNEDGLFIGGVIMPGILTALHSLRRNTDAVKDIYDIEANLSPAAQSTEDAVAAGIMLGLTGGIERVIKEQSLLVETPAKVLLCGGDSKKIAPYLTIPFTLQPDLVLQGLRVFATQE